MPMHVHVFNTHSHWDHIQGLPFFIPLFVPGNDISIYGAYDPVTQKGVEQVLSIQMQYRFFPIRECELNAGVHYVSLKEEEPVTIGNTTVTPVLMNHPVINFGYRIDCGGKSLFFTGDHEPTYNIYEPEDDEYGMFQTLIDEKNDSIIERIRDVDVLIADSSYTEEEYPAKKGWGHGTFDSCMYMGEQARVQQLYLTHHEPTRDDDALEAVFKKSMAKRRIGVPEIDLAREGLFIEW